MVIVGFVAVILCWSPGAAQDRPLPPLKRIVDSGLAVRLPIHSCSVPSTVARLARVLSMAAGVEYLPGDCSAEWEKARPGADEGSLQGMTVEEALNKLVELDGRYRWVESSGVIVMRPVEAWSDPKNLLNLGATSVGGVLDAVVRAHGAMWWEVSDRPMVADGQPDRMIWLRTFDGVGLGTSTKAYQR